MNISNFKIKLVKIFIASLFIFPFFSFRTAYAVEQPTVTYSVNKTNIAPGDTFDLIVSSQNLENFFGASIDFRYDPSLLEFVSIQKGTVLNGEEIYDKVVTNNAATGELSYISTIISKQYGISRKSSTLFSIKLKALKTGTMDINNLSAVVKLSTNDGNKINFNQNNLKLNIKNRKDLTLGKYEEDNLNLSLYGNWKVDNNYNHSGNKAIYSGEIGDYLEFSFSGTGFRWIAPVNIYRSIAKVTVDDQSYMVDNFSYDSIFQKCVYEKKDLENKSHKVKIEIIADKNSASSTYAIALDSIDILSPLTAGRYEENSAGIIRNGNWIVDNDPRHNGSNAIYSNNPGDSIEFSFSGTGFKWITPVNIYRGIAKVTIDGKTYSVDNYSKDNLFKKSIFEKGDLPNGTHSVKIEVTYNRSTYSEAYALALDYIEILSPLDPGKHEETSNNIALNGKWLSDSNPQYNSGKVVYSNNPGDSIEFSFNGTGLRWTGPVNIYRGIAKVTIDNTTYSVDNYSENSILKKTIFEKNSLQPGTHTVKIEVTSNRSKNAEAYALALDSIEILVPGPILKSGKYENGSNGIILSGKWLNDANNKHSGGSAIYSNTPGDFIEFNFNGTGFRWVTPLNIYRGIAEVVVDDKLYYVDNYSKDSIFQKSIFEKSDLPNGNHTVKISVTPNRQSAAEAYALALDYIEILSPLSPGIYEENSTNINLKGTWLSDSDGRHSLGKAVYSNSPGDSIEFSFNGTGFKWVTPVNIYRGIAKITIDGATYYADNYSSNSIFQKNVFEKSGLSSGVHKVKIEVTSNRSQSSEAYALALDYIQILK